MKTAGDSKVPGQARVIVTVYGENGKTDDIVLDLSRLADDSTDGEEEGDHHSEQVSRKDRKGRKRGKENRREDQEKGTSDEDEEKLFQPGNTDKFNVCISTHLCLSGSLCTSVKDASIKDGCTTRVMDSLMDVQPGLWIHLWMYNQSYGFYALNFHQGCMCQTK